jgi:hypothetical protein
MVKGNVVSAGHILICEREDLRRIDGARPTEVGYALLIQFAGPDEVRAAMADGRVEFTIFGEPAHDDPGKEPQP